MRQSVGILQRLIWVVGWIGMQGLPVHLLGLHGDITDTECRNLMAKDEFKNLGFGDDKAKEAEGGKKGELRWE